MQLEPPLGLGAFAEIFRVAATGCGEAGTLEAQVDSLGSCILSIIDSLPQSLLKIRTRACRTR